MHHTEENNQDGLLMLIDFEKAFDSISWNFLYKALRFFNFGENICKWIKILNTEITATIQQCGFLSDPIDILRGCRQGDPIASLDFLVCAQFLFLLIDRNKNIKGIKIKDEEYKLSQFADDTTMILDGTQTSLQATLNTIEIFGTYSGLKMNKDKTKLIWIGRKKGSKEKLNTTSPLVWGDTQFDLLGLKYDVELDKMIEINY